MEKKPEWLKVRYNQDAVNEVAALMRDLKLNTVCKEANCPNLGECYQKHTSTFMILGSVFLATTGAEALYSDMGHVGRGNIYASWPFVKACLLLNYLGQGA